MKRTFVITFSGVVRKIFDEQPIVQMVDMLRTLGGDTTFIYLADDPADKIEEWLDLHGLPHVLVLGKDKNCVQQMHRITHEWGYHVDFVIEPDPARVVSLVNAGFPVLGYFHPYYAKNSWRPDHQFSITPWDEIKDSIAKQQSMRANDHRSDEE